MDSQYTWAVDNSALSAPITLELPTPVVQVKSMSIVNGSSCALALFLDRNQSTVADLIVPAFFTGTLPISFYRVICALVLQGQPVQGTVFFHLFDGVLPATASPVGPPVLSSSGIVSQTYNDLIISTQGLEYFWPLDDAAGSKTARQIGPIGGNTGTPSGNISFGSTPLTIGGDTSAYSSDGAYTSYIALATGSPGGGNPPLALEFWYDYQQFDPLPVSTQQYDVMLGNNVAGPMRIALDKANGDFGVSNGVGGITDFGIFPASNKAHYVVVQQQSDGYWLIYHDNVLILNSNAHALAVMNEPWYAFGVQGYDTPSIIGNISKIAFYGVILSASQIAQRWAYRVS